MRWSRDTTTQTIRAIHPVVLCKVQILAPPPDFERKKEMGQRLNIEIKIAGKVQANAYYHWSGYTNSAKGIAFSILREAYKFPDGDPALRAIRLLEISGAGLTYPESCEALKMYPEETFSPNEGRNNGLIAITPDAIKETRSLEEGRITLDFDKNIVKFNVYFKRAAKEYYKDEYYKNRTIHAELLRSPFYMTFDYFIDEFFEQDFEHFCFKYKNLIIEPIY